MTDQRSLNALDVAERHANGQATGEELSAAWIAAKDAEGTVRNAGASQAAQSAAWAAAQAAQAARDAALAIGDAAREAALAIGDAARDAARAVQAAKFREMVSGMI